MLCDFWGRRWKGELVAIEDEHDLPPQIRIKLRTGGEYVIFIRRAIPSFKSVEEESDFWDEHNVRDFFWEPADDIELVIEEALDDVQAGDVKQFDDVESLIAELHDEVDDA